MTATTDATETGSRYASRKFVLSLLVILEAGALVALHLIDASVWATITGAALATYQIANVAQKATSGS